jgi:hypothetical protein
MSRKKLRRLMPLNRAALTGSMLSVAYGREPGRGGYRSRRLMELDDLEQEQLKLGEKGMEAAAEETLKWLKNLFSSVVRKIPKQRLARRKS